MLLKQELINKIKDYFNLNIYETKIWLALLSKGIASAGEVSSISGVPRSRAYDVLESLEKKGFAIVKLDKPVKYIGLKPKNVLDRLKINIQESAKERIENLSKIKSSEEFKKLEEIYTQSIAPVKKDNVSVLLKGKSIISNHLKELFQSAQKEVIICSDTEYINRRLILFKKTFNRLMKNKIKIKIALLGDKNIIDNLSKALNIKIKPTEIESKFFIIDRKQILFYVSKYGPEKDIAIWLNSKFFSESFATLFERSLNIKDK